MILTEENNDREVAGDLSDARLLISPRKNDVPSGFPQSTTCRWFYKTKKHLLLSGIIFASTLGSLMWGFHFSVIAGAMLFVDDYLNLSAIWHEVIVSVTIAGATIGSAAAGEISDKFGRRKALMISAVLYGVGALIMGAAFSQLFLVIGRTVVGIAIGMLVCYTIDRIDVYLSIIRIHIV